MKLGEVKFLQKEDHRVNHQDPTFDDVRKKANEVANYLRHHGPFGLRRLGLDDLGYTTMPQLMKKLEDRFVPE
ncbi:MAG TPA: fructose 1,6-bisphosphatase [Syntrophales bacterium]|nr:fructose 1,6-bisphosphatase [Syntrophales bacterium]